MALYKVKHEFTVCVEADSMYAALDKALEAIHGDHTVPWTGSGTLLTRTSQVPREWRKRVPVGAGFTDGKMYRPRCEEYFAKAKP